MIRMITTFFGVGLLRPAPGTWGSAAAVALGVLFCELGAAWLVPVGTVLATLLGFWAVPRAVAGLADKDPSEIVIDEVAGQWLAMSFTVIPLWWHGVSILAAWPGFVAPFLLFRLFDIWKPWLVG
ncbi:phosphatidylglycerophosphatase A, partial [Paracoccus sp. (in: a-proteobacteria)]|uniref:phosphatidylglycerophosphatase A family protein n=1 Tax=Paracoccus sp. TaxID=267 RepID=UPI003A857F4A